MHDDNVTILILVDGFLQSVKANPIVRDVNTVTILILVDGFLQYVTGRVLLSKKASHNPYFSRWFSAIGEEVIFQKHLLKSQSLF